MRYASANAFRTALETRLRTQAQETGLPLVRLRKAIVFDRVLARLLIVAEGRWILKGGLALDFRFGSRTRTTKDMDLGRYDDVDAATTDFIVAQRVKLDDYFIFSVEKTDKLDALDDAAAVRYRAHAQLVGRPFETVVIDVGFSDVGVLAPERLPGTDLLSFANVSRIEVPTLPLAQHVAEKVHAYTRRYGTQALPSTRVKDIVDLALIASMSRVDGAYTALGAGELGQTFRHTFIGRGQQVLPPSLPEPPHDWADPYRKLAAEIGIDLNIGVGYRDAQALIDPILAASVDASAHWSPRHHAWIV